MFYKNLKVLALVLVAFLLTGCTTLQQALIDIVTPEITVVGNPYIVNAELPIIGTGEVTVRVPVEAYNPNLLGIQLSKVDLGLFLNSDFVANGVFEDGRSLGSNGRTEFNVDVNLPILNVIAAFPALSDLFFGNPTRVTVDAIVTIDVLNTIKVSGKTIIFDASVSQ